MKAVKHRDYREAIKMNDKAQRDYRRKIEKLIWEKCQENTFLKVFGYFTKDDPFMELDYKLSCSWVDTVEELKQGFKSSNAFRCCLIYKDLIFVNSDTSGYWEAWTLKKFGEELIPFESISMDLIIEKGTYDGLTFEEYIEEMQAMTREQCVNYFEYCDSKHKL